MARNILHTLIACAVFFQVNIHHSYGQGVVFGAALGSETGKPGSVYYQLLDHAMNVVKANSTFLTQFHKDVSRLEVNYYVGSDVYPATSKVCQFIKDDRPSVYIIASDVCSDCGDIGALISQSTRGPIFTVDSGQVESRSRAIKMYPTPEDMSTFFIDMLQYFKWRKWTIVFEGNQYQNMEPILNWADANQFNVTLREYTGDLDELAEKIKGDKNQNILLATETEQATLDIVANGIEKDIFGSTYHWMLAYLDVFIDRSLLDTLEEKGVYITRFKMNYTTEWQYTYPTLQIDNRESKEWTMGQKLVFDAFITGAYGLMRYHERQDESVTISTIFPGVSVITPCPGTPDVPVLSDLFHDMRWYNFEGLTGNIAFDEFGNRVNYSLMIHSGRGRALDQLRGEWVQNPDHWEDRYNLKYESATRLNITRYLKGEDRKLQIVSIEAPPFLTMKNGGDSEPSNGRFQGFIMDLLEEIKSNIKRIEFNYEVELVPDGKYGRPGKYSKIWSGMVGEVYRGKSDIAAGPLSIRPDRTSAVAFTYPFMDAGIKAMVQHPNHVKDDVFSFFYPFAVEVWILNILIFFIVSGVLYLCNYLSPYEWRAAAERGDAFAENYDNFNAGNSAWFLASTLFFQSFDASPRSNAGRVMAVFWWAFVIIMVFLFITTIPRYLNLSKQLTRIRTIHELVNQVEVQPGLIEAESSFYFFKKSKDQTHNQLYKTIQNANPTGKVGSMEEAVKRIRESGGKYAFLGESPILEYEASKEPCDLFVGSGSLVQQSYGLAVRKGSPLEEPLSHAIQNLRDSGVLHRLELNWWDKYSRCGNLTTWEKQGIRSYTSHDLRGIYILFILGVIISLVMFLVEFLFCGGKRRIADDNEKPGSDMNVIRHEENDDGGRQTEERQWL